MEKPEPILIFDGGKSVTNSLTNTELPIRMSNIGKVKDRKYRLNRRRPALKYNINLNMRFNVDLITHALYRSNEFFRSVWFLRIYFPFFGVYE